MWPGRLALQGEDLADTGFDDFFGGEEGDGVEITLDGDVRAEGFAGCRREGCASRGQGRPQPVSRMVGRRLAVSTPK